MDCTSTKDPGEILSGLSTALKACRVAFTEASPWLLQCKYPRVRFEVNIAHLDDMQSMHVVRFKRRAGEDRIYQQVVAQIVDRLHL